MGQLEKYGLYVLCLVIFLILGVAIFADGQPVQAGPRRDLAAFGAPGGASGAARQGNASRQPRVDVDLSSLLSTVEPPSSAPANRPAAEPPKSAPPGESPAPAPNAGSGAEQPSPPDTVRAVHVVRPNDTFDKIARTLYGRATLAGEIQRLNPNVHPTKLRVGTEIVLPSRADLAKRHPELAAALPGGGAKKPEVAKDAPKSAPKNEKPGAPRSYVIKKGDTFEGVAQALLGDKKRTEEIKRLNPTLDPTKLKVGGTIQVPAK